MDLLLKPVPDETSRRRLAVGSVLVAVGCALILLLTSPGLPMVWDEGNAIRRAEGVARWFGQGRQGIAEDWRYTTCLEGHPAFYGIVIAAGRWLSGQWLGPLESARFGPMMLFGLAAGAMFYRLGREYSVAAGLGAVAALMTLPRMFAHAHFASFDGPLTSCWILTWATFTPAGRGACSRTPWRQAVFWGIVLGMTLSCKATGWIAPVPFIAWTLIYRDRAAAKTLAVGLPVALLTFFVLNPPLWHDPFYGWLEFFNLNLHRAARFNIPIRFLGESHHLGNPLPWYNTLLWTAVTVPLGTLLLAAIGTAGVFRRCRTQRPGILLAANWLVLLIVRALPMVPPHDGVRLFLPSFAFLAALAGVGCHQVLSWVAKRRPDSARARRFAVAALGLIYAGSASSLFWYAPQWLSYYNLLIGGLPGATTAGMEPTYYWDGLDRPVLDWLHENTAADEKIRFGGGSPENLGLMQNWWTLRRKTPYDGDGGEFRWYVLQHRPGPWPWHPIDPWLIEHSQPAYRKTIRRPALRAVLQGWGLDVPPPWRLDVPLVEVYDYREYLRARGAAGGRDMLPENPPG